MNCGLNTFRACLLVVFFISCSQPAFIKRKPSSSSVDLIGIFEEIQADVTKGTNSATVCKDGLTAHYEQLLRIRSANIDIEQYSDGELSQIIETSFLTRLDIASKLSILQIKSKEDTQCLGSVQDIVRALRYAEDYLVEILVTRNQGSVQDKTFTNFKGEAPYLLTNPKFRFKGIESLQGGDIILSRGNAFSSAAIARIGAHDMQFSHLSFVYEDPNGELHTTEAHIEIGNVVAPFQAHIDEKNARSVVFRYKDPKLAAKASELIYKRVKAAQDSGKNIEYDFAMDLKDSSRIFCSEVVHIGFKMASNGSVDVPRFKTKFTKGMIPFLQTLGIAINESNVDTFETFAPGDIQFDSNFDLVAEWRNPARMKDSRQKDAILTMIFKWMEEGQYRFRPALSMSLRAQVGWLARRLPVVRSKLEEQFPLNMTTSQLKLFFVLDEVAAPMQNYLEQAQKNHQVPMTPLEMYEALEKFRSIDRENFKLTLKYKSELQDLERDRDNRNSYRARELRKLIKKHTPLFHEKFRPNKF